MIRDLKQNTSAEPSAQSQAARRAAEEAAAMVTEEAADEHRLESKESRAQCSRAFHLGVVGWLLGQEGST